MLTFCIFLISVEVLRAQLLREVKRNKRLRVAVYNARCDTRFPRRKKYCLRKKF